MGIENFNISSHFIDNLNPGLFSKSDGAYSYFKAEYHHVLPYDIEREMLGECVRPKRQSSFLLNIKHRLLKHSFVLVPVSSTAHAYFRDEYKGNPMARDSQDNIIVPDSFYSKKMTR